MIARLLPAALAWAALPWAAAAADLPTPAVAPTMLPTAAPAFSWTGFYLGGAAGYASERSSLGGFTGPLAPYLGGRRDYDLSSRTDGFTGGAQLGYNLQFGAGAGPVVGIEADLSYADLAREHALPGAGPESVATFRTSLDEVGTVRARAGYGFGPLLAYGTGGVAFGKADRQSILSGPGGATALRLDLRDLDMGYAVGGGIEYALPIGLAPALLGAGAVTLRAEYIHVDMGQDGVPLTVGPQAFTAHLRARADIGRTGINYKF